MVSKLIGVSNKIRDPNHPPNPFDSADLTPVMVGGGSSPPKFKNGESVDRLSPQNPKKPDRTKI